MLSDCETLQLLVDVAQNALVLVMIVVLVVVARWPTRTWAAIVLVLSSLSISVPMLYVMSLTIYGVVMSGHCEQLGY